MITTAAPLPYLLSKESISSLLKILFGSLFIALLAQISIPLFFTPVPLSGQTFAVMLIGATFGSRKSALAVLLYLVEGALGLPVFAGGLSGITFGPTFGYLIGFIAQAFIIGWIFERMKTKESPKVLITLLFASMIQMAIGMLWLSSFVGVSQVFVLGLLPFIPGDILKILAVTAYLKMRR